jgi:hypothetical protein
MIYYDAVSGASLCRATGKAGTPTLIASKLEVVLLNNSSFNHTRQHQLI